MIARYSRDEMVEAWSLESKFQCMQDVEVAVALTQAELKIIPKTAAISIQKKSRFSVKRIAEIEKETKHDVIAFVSNLAENVGPAGRYIHFGLTSSDVLDTAMSLNIRQAHKVLEKTLNKMNTSLKKVVRQHKQTWCSGRTHGMHAEPTTFGLKMAGHLAEFQRCCERYKLAYKNTQIGKLSGAVGTYSAQSVSVEKKVCQKLKLKPEVIATQVVPRDRHADLIYALGMLGCFLERLAVELRHLQRTELQEVTEGFSKGQKGSSAMPHKKNPISAENLTGVARMLRSYVIPAMENIALWHERDISHSSVERVVFPDAFILADYGLERMSRVLDGLYVNKEKMKENMDISGGQLFSSHVLLELVKKGLSREEAYKLVQKVSHGMKKGQHLREELLKHKETCTYFSKKQLDTLFSGKAHAKSIEAVIQRVLRK